MKLSPLQLTGLFQFTVRLASETEARFTSVERIHHYIQVLGTDSFLTGYTGLSVVSHHIHLYICLV